MNSLTSHEGKRHLGVIQTACNDIDMKLLCGEIVSQMWNDQPYDYVVVDHSDQDNVFKYEYLKKLSFPGSVILKCENNPGHQQGWANAVTEGWEIGKELGWTWILYLSGNTIPVMRGLKRRFEKFKRSGQICGWPHDPYESYFGGAYGLVKMSVLTKSKVLEDPRWRNVGDIYTEPLITDLFEIHKVPCVDWPRAESGLLWHFRREIVSELLDREKIHGVYANQVREGTERFLFHPERKVGHYYR